MGELDNKTSVTRAAKEIIGKQCSDENLSQKKSLAHQHSDQQKPNANCVTKMARR